MMIHWNTYSKYIRRIKDSKTTLPRQCHEWSLLSKPLHDNLDVIFTKLMTLSVDQLLRNKNTKKISPVKLITAVNKFQNLFQLTDIC